MIVHMGTNMIRHYVRDSKRELRRRRLQTLAYMALAALAAVTAAVVMLALNK